MKIVLAGGTGFLGTALADALADDRHELVVLTRRTTATPAPRRRLVPWTPNGESGDWGREIDGAGVVVNLAGESIAGKRWSAAQKERFSNGFGIVSGQVRHGSTSGLTTATRPLH